MLVYVLQGVKLEWPAHAPRDIRRLMMLCHDLKPEARPTFADIERAIGEANLDDQPLPVEPLPDEPLPDLESPPPTKSLPAHPIPARDAGGSCLSANTKLMSTPSAALLLIPCFARPSHNFAQKWSCPTATCQHRTTPPSLVAAM